MHSYKRVTLYMHRIKAMTPQSHSAAPTKPNHTPSRHSRAKGKLLLQTVTWSCVDIAACNAWVSWGSDLAVMHAQQPLGPRASGVPDMPASITVHSICIRVCIYTAALRSGASTGSHK